MQSTFIDYTYKYVFITIAVYKNTYKSKNEVTLYFTLYCECIIKPVPNYFTKTFYVILAIFELFKSEID